KFAIVVVIGAGAAALLDVFQRRDPSALLVGGATLLLAAYAPYKLLRVLPALEVAAIHVFDGGGRHSLAGLHLGAWHAYSISREFSRSASAAATAATGATAAGAAPVGAALVAALALGATNPPPPADGAAREGPGW